MLIRFSTLLVLAFSSLSLSAASPVGGDIQQIEGVITTSPVNILTNIITYAIGVAAIMGVIGITWWGIQMILAIGDDEKMKKGRYIIIFSIVGVIIAGLAYGVVNLVGNIRI